MNLSRSDQAFPLPRMVFATCLGILLLQLPGIWLSQSGHLSWGILWGQGIGIALPILGVVWWKRYAVARLFPRHWPGPWAIVVTVVATIAVATLSDALVAIWDAEVRHRSLAYHEALRVLLMTHAPAEIVGRVLLFCVVPALIEELAFRGFCQTSLAAAYGPRIALVITAALFAVLHGQPWYLPFYLLLGLYLGVLYRWKGTLWLPIVAHFVNNLWTMLYYLRASA